MKNTIYSLCTAAVFALSCSSLLAQVPSGINYQAALRSTAGQPMTNQAITIRFGIYSGIMMNLKVYEETQSLTTSAQGLVNCVIGKGAVVLGNMKTIAWGKDQHHLKVEVNSGSGFVDMGTSQILGVPYAQFANGATHSDTALYAGSAGFANGASNASFAMTAGSATNATTAGTANTALTANNAGHAKTSGLSDTANLAMALDNSAKVDHLQLSTTGANTNEILRWNGSNWVSSPETTLSPGDGIIITSGVISTPWSSNGSDVYNNTSGNVGIGISSPAAKLDVSGNVKANAIQLTTGAAANRVLTSDASGNASWQANSGTLAVMASFSGPGNLPLTTGTVQFIASPVAVTITSTSQNVYITSSKALGSSLTGGASGLNLYMAYNTTGSANPVTTMGGGSFGYQCLQNERNSYTLSFTATGLSPGTYYFGLAAGTTNANWNSQEYSYTSVMVFN